MDIYNYNDNGLFTKITKARPDPENPGGWMFPRNSTTIEVPLTGVNESAHFDGSAWSILIDFRGHSVWSKLDASHVVIEEFGPIHEGVTLVDPEGTEYPIWDVDHWITDTVARDTALAIQQRRDDIIAAQELEGGSGYTVVQLDNYLDTQYDSTDFDAAGAIINNLADTDMTPAARAALIAMFQAIKTILGKSKAVDRKIAVETLR